MRKFCRQCGTPLIQNRCVNPDCPGDEEDVQTTQEEQGCKRPITLRERRRRMYEAELRKSETEEETLIVEEEEIQEENEKAPSSEPQEQTQPPKEKEASATDPEKAPKPKTSEKTVQTESEKRPTPPKAKPGEQKPKEKEREKTQEADNNEGALLRLSFFVSDYYREPGRVVVAAARKRDTGIGLILIFVSLWLSALGTLIFGAMHLEDFFARWVVCGIVMPILAYGFSLLYGRLYIAFSPVGRNRKKGAPGSAVTFRELFAVVTVASVVPNQILFMSCILSPMDKELRIFQFFALLMTVAWILCLLFSLFTVYGGEFSFGGLVLTVAFGFLAFVALRAVWVWFLTGDFRLSLYIPLNVFME